MDFYQLCRRIPQVVLQVLERRVTEEKFQIHRAGSVVKEVRGKSPPNCMHAHVDTFRCGATFDEIVKATMPHASSITMCKPKGRFVFFSSQ
jgi:hypothetical protein